MKEADKIFLNPCNSINEWVNWELDTVENVARSSGDPKAGLKWIRKVQNAETWQELEEMVGQNAQLSLEIGFEILLE